MNQPGSITQMVEQLEADQTTLRNQAAQAIWERYAPQLRQLAGKHLACYIRRREDEDDVLQRMYLVFCQCRRQGRLAVEDRDNLWKVFLWLTRNECRRTAKRHTCKARDVRHEQGPPASGEDSGGPLEQAQAAEPSPEDAEGMLRLLVESPDNLPDAQLRQVLLLKLAGHTNREIADQLGCEERTVERKLLVIRIVLLDLQGHAPEEIAEALGHSLATVERKLEQLRRRAEEPVA